MAAAMKNKPNKTGNENKNYHRFFVGAECISETEVILSAQQTHQICNVLRLKAGERIVVLDNSGNEHEVLLTTVEKSQIVCEIVEKRRAAGEPAIEMTLFQSMLAREKFEFVLQKCTEVGAARFVPVITEHCIVQKGKIKEGKFERWKTILKEASEQSHRGRIPKLDEPVKFFEALEQTADFDCVLISVPSAKLNLRECLSNCRKAKRIGLFIGPEGGFSQAEIDQAGAKGVLEFGMGPRVMRTETAAVVAAALILYELGEMEY